MNERQSNTEILIETANLAAIIVLANGGETYRAEETAERICQAGGIDKPEVFALPTGVFISITDENGHVVSRVKRLKKRSANMQNLERVNTLARQYDSGKLSLEELHSMLTDISNNAKKESIYLLSIACGIASAGFTLLLENQLSLFPCLFDCMISFICGFIVQFITTKLTFGNTFHFMSCFISGIIVASAAVSAVSVFHIGNISSITVGALTPLFPGLALTTAIRDTSTGDLVSGNARLLEVLIIAIALASGAGVVFAAYLGLGGVI